MKPIDRLGLAVITEAYPRGTTAFSAIPYKVRATNPDALGAATFFEDAVAITRQMKELNLNPRMSPRRSAPVSPNSTSGSNGPRSSSTDPPSGSPSS